MTIMDKLLTRDFQTRLSWTGCSRTPGVEKTSMEQYRAVFGFIHELLVQDNVTADDLRIRVIKTLRNASSRNVATVQRKPTKRTRISKKNTASKCALLKKQKIHQ